MKDVFDGALAVPPEARAAYLAKACGIDQARKSLLQSEARGCIPDRIRDAKNTSRDDRRLRSRFVGVETNSGPGQQREVCDGVR